jgi:hypothetical protein
MGISDLRHLLAMLVAIISLPVAAQIQTSGDGQVALGAQAQSSFAFGNFTLAAGQGRWRGRLGMFGVVGRLHETYADIAYDGGSWQIAGGFPRPAFDGFAAPVLMDLAPRLALEQIATGYSRATYGTMVLPKYLPYGVQITGQISGVDYAASVHIVPDYGDIIAGIGARGGQDALHWDIAAELVQAGNDMIWNAKIGLSTVHKDWAAGLALYHAKANGDPDQIAFWGRFDARQDLQLTTLWRATPAQDLLLGIGLDYQLFDDWHVTGAMMGNAVADPTFSASLVHKL